MANWIPFLLISVVSIFVLMYTGYKIKQPLVIFFWLFISGVSYFFEFIIFIILDSYTYEPLILRNSYNDNVLGSVSSQLLAVPVAITFATFLTSKKRWIFAFVGIFAIIEEIFLKIGVYDHYWWKSYYTSFFLTIAFFLARYWYSYLQKKEHMWHYLITLFFALSTIVLTSTWALSSLIGIYKIHLGWFDNEIKDITSGNILYFWLATYFYSLVIFYKNRDWKYLLAGLLFFSVVEFYMWRNGIITSKYNLNLLIFPSLHLMFIILFGSLYRQFFPYFLPKSNQLVKQKKAPSSS
ncbi:hypothetical protein JOC86_003141 [Bacillus pakistanensis]|uniref:Uncharacterized protein n=1 Tax=Rossellomorea pakistanensis TaxID=992288 RepID=A0ABS2NFG4_9BACI|nr:hypothetical protein [Bacillus pakistanensis]MBM7586589.1 hypothetical protein [Bacillus pakistanensis]